MPSVSCPTCGEKGRIPANFIGIRIKCTKCGNSFLVTPPVPKAAVAAAAGSPPLASTNPTGIAVEGSGASDWSPTGTAAAVHDHDHDHEHDPGHGETSPAFTSSQLSEPVSRQYKVLTQKDKWFEGKFDLGRLEEALNHYARQGWVVRSMATPHITGFSGGTREELVILLER
jgi:hypothetical protein